MDVEKDVDEDDYLRKEVSCSKTTERSVKLNVPVTRNTIPVKTS